MTVIDKRDRIERLATEPLFYYRTLRDHVEQLDSLKVAFQYLLAAYELNMDEEEKQARRTAQLQELGKAAAEGANVTTSGPGLREFVQEQVTKTLPGLRTVSDSPSIHVTGGKASGMPQVAKPGLAPQAPRPISTRAAEVGAVVAGITAAHAAAGDAVADDTESEGLSDDSILEAKRVLSRKLVAEKVNEVLIKNDIHFTEEQLYDYMDNKMSKADLERIGRQVAQQTAPPVRNPIEKPVQPGVEEVNEFPLTQVGMAQKMFHGPDGLLSKILGPALHRNGQGPINSHDKSIVLLYNTDNGTVGIGDVEESGICRYGEDSYGLAIILEKTEKHPWQYFVWLPAYKQSDTQVPMIYCTKYLAYGFSQLTDMPPAEVSDVVNRLVHYLAQWQKGIAGRGQAQPAIPGSLNELAEEAPRSTVLKMPPASKEYPITTNLGRIQRQLYSTDGILSVILGPKLHRNGRGPVRELTGHCSSYAESDTVFKVDAPMTGVWVANSIAGILLNADKGTQYWLPLMGANDTEMPSVYVSLGGSASFRNLDTHSPNDIDVLSMHLFSHLEAWLKSYPDQ
jgi:hypothetical protein